MARRSPARLLAPLALVGFVIALLVVINGSSTGGAGVAAPAVAASVSASAAASTSAGSARRITAA